MNARLIFKFVFIIAVLLFMVMMGMSNNMPIAFHLNPLNLHTDQISAALMFFIFFGAGLVTGGVMALGPGGKGSKSSKSSKD